MTSSFLSKLCFEDEYGLPFALLQPLEYSSELLSKSIDAKANVRIVIPAGFKTDLASIPRPLWNVLPPIGRYDRAAVVHDFLYQTAPNGVTRGQADSVLNEAMKVCGVGAFTRFLIYSGVRVGGGGTWARYRRAKVATA